MYVMMENKVQDCCGQEAFECHMQVAKVVLIASMQETAKVTCHRGRTEQMPNLHHKSVHWKEKPC